MTDDTETLPLAGAGSDDAVVWHDLECGTYDADLPLWLELAGLHAGPVLDIGAGTGRVALALARAGHAVHALDSDARLLHALSARARAGALAVTCVCADACGFSLQERFGLCVVPMQTVHLLADPAAFLDCAHAVLLPQGLLALALLGDGVSPFEMELEPERIERAGVRYASHPTALRLEAGTIVLERRRERTDASGVRTDHLDVIRLAPAVVPELLAAATDAGFTPHGSRIVPPTRDRAGSFVLLMQRTAR